MAHACNPSTQEVQDQEFKVILNTVSCKTVLECVSKIGWGSEGERL